MKTLYIGIRATDFTPEQLATIGRACGDRQEKLIAAGRIAAAGRPATQRLCDSAATLFQDADRSEQLRAKTFRARLKPAEADFSRADIETALEAVKARHAVFNRTLDRATAVACGALVTLLSDLAADTAFVHDEY